MLGFDFDITGTESVRQTGQVFLEKLRSDDQHHSSQQGATPFDIASDIAGLALRYHPGREISFLDPCVGSGIFFSALLHDAPDHDGGLEIRAAHGAEPDEQFAALAHDLWAPAGLTVHDLNFLRLSAADLPKATLVLSRPPTTAHHRLTSDQKVLAADCAEEATGIRPTGLADAYIHFLLASHKFLAPGAVSAWLLPTAFLQRTAGQALRSYLARQVRIQRIHTYDHGILGTAGHDEAILDWSLVIFTNQTAQPTDTFKFSTGGELFGADSTVEVPYTRLDPDTSWANLDQQGDAADRVSYIMDDFFRIRRGWTAPGENFFVMDENRAWALGLQPFHMHPMLPHPKDIATDIIEADEWGYPKDEPRRVVIFSRYDTYSLETKDPAFLKYLDAANGDTINESEERGNKAWYNLHLPGVAPILVQPAKADDPAPFRFVQNQSNGIAGPGWITLYPNLAWAQPELILNGIDWDAVQLVLEAIRLPDPSKKPELTPQAVASLDATVIAEYFGLTDKRA